jgi:flagellar basal-body rod modification protein FlgD
MDISSITRRPPQAAAPEAGSASVLSSQFMQLLLAQLRNQNPLEPMQDQDFMAQVAQLNSLGELQKLNSTLEHFTRSSQVAEAASLLGRMVTYTAADGARQTGVVTGVSLEGGQVVLLLGGSVRVSLANVSNIQVVPQTGMA